MVNRTIISRIREYFALLTANGIPVEAGVLFGSYARGAERPDSDIDLLVLSPVFDAAKPSHLVDMLWRLRRHADPRIEPFPVGVREYATDTASPLLWVAREQGVVIRPARTRSPKAPALKIAEAQAKYAAKRKR